MCEKANAQINVHNKNFNFYFIFNKERCQTFPTDQTGVVV